VSEPVPTELSGEQVRLRPLGEDDVDRLTEILTAPGVAEWWVGYDRERVARELLDGHWFAVEYEGRTIGTVGYWEENEPDYRYAGIDISLDPASHGRGLGADAVRTMARWLFEARGHHRITIDPAATNTRAIRCYERVGFRRVGVLRRYERLPDGSFRDGLLMDLLPEELS
jgi:aminoglycoside 6'-N-acetyltransferase